MLKLNFLSSLRHAVLALMLAGGASLAAAADTYHVEVDTSAYSGTGYFDLFFNGADGAPAALATLSNFSGALDTLVYQDTNVTGSLAGGAVFTNDVGLGELYHSVVLGAKFSFDIHFSGDYMSVASDAGSAFSLSIYDSSQMAYLGYEGAAVMFSLLPINAAGPAGITAEGYGLATVTAVPEPAEWLMLFAGLAVVSLMARRRQRG